MNYRWDDCCVSSAPDSPERRPALRSDFEHMSESQTKNNQSFDPKNHKNKANGNEFNGQNESQRRTQKRSQEF